MLRSDLVLERDVAAELAGDSACCGIALGISVKNGVVTLSGTVADAALGHAAVRAARRVFGVDGIDPCIVVGPCAGSTVPSPESP